MLRAGKLRLMHRLLRAIGLEWLVERALLRPLFTRLKSLRFVSDQIPDHYLGPLAAGEVHKMVTFVEGTAKNAESAKKIV